MNEFSKGVAAKLFGAFPELKEFESVIEENGDVALYVEVKAPSENASQPLRIDTLNEEITVSFDAYHMHFYDFQCEEREDAHSMIQRIFSDQFAVVSYWRDDQWCGSILLGQDELPVNNAEYPYANCVQFRSWRGSLDGSISCEPKG